MEADPIMKATLLKCTVVLLLLAVLFYFGCPFYELLHIQCPVCGVTRAWLSAFHGEFRRAFSYHLFFPLIPFLIPAFFLLDHKRFPYRKQLQAALVCFAVVLAVYNLIRGICSV